MFDKNESGPCKGATLPQGAFKGASGGSSISGAAPMKGPYGTLARTLRHPCKDPAAALRQLVHQKVRANCKIRKFKDNPRVHLITEHEDLLTFTYF